MEFIIGLVFLVIWALGCASGFVMDGFIHFFLVAGVVTVLVRLTFGPANPRTEKKVKISFKVDTDSAAKAQQQIRDLQEALRFFVDRSDDVSEQLELERARNEMKDRHKAEIVDLFERYQRLAHWVQDDRDAAEAEVKGLRDEVEHMRTQMAAITTAALGWATEPATRGMYGWSVPYQDVLDLRRKYDLFRGRVTYIDNL